MGLVGGFHGEDGGQAAALDVAVFALLVSISAWTISTYGLGAYNADLHLRAVENRYALEFAHGFVLTARYLSESSVSSSNYTLGPLGACSEEEGEELMYRFSRVVEASLGSSPLRREIRGGVIDLLVDDIYFSLALHLEDEEYALSNRLMTGCYHEAVDEAIADAFEFLSGSAFDYRIEARWIPYEGSGLENFIYSEVSYGPSTPPPDAPAYAVTFQVAMPADEKRLSGLGTAIKGFSQGLEELSSIIPDPRIEGRGERLSEVMARASFPEVNAPTPINDRAEVTLILWPKVWR